MRSKDEEARFHADFHYTVEDGMHGIYRIRHRQAEIESLAEEPIKLLDVNSDTIAAGIMPLGFRAHRDHGYQFDTVIVEITPDEFDQLIAGKLKLPTEWLIAELLPRPEHEFASSDDLEIQAEDIGHGCDPDAPTVILGKG